MIKGTMKVLVLVAVFTSSVALAVAATAASFANELPIKYIGQTTSITSAPSLGVVNTMSGMAGHDPNVFKEQAAFTLMDILVEHNDFTGDEIILPTEDDVHFDDLNNMHLRFQQYLSGKPIEGATIMMHIKDGGSIFAVNGESYPSNSIIETDTMLSCEEAVEIALEQYGVINGEWISSEECVLAAVQAQDGSASLAFKRMIGYVPEGDGPYQIDKLYASPSTGALLAVHPTVASAMALASYDCQSHTPYSQHKFQKQCVLTSNSSRKIDTADDILDAAHNHAIDTYEFYSSYLGRDSIDDKGKALKSYVNYGSNYNNAYFSPLYGGMMVYGDGDGIIFTPLSAGLDVAVHEFSHGVTYYTSNLVYQKEAGALNEAFSDCMAAAADRLILEKSVADVWRAGEDIYVPGGGLRDMSNPALKRDYDYYPERYRGTDDHGGVHWNSGIMNLAFVLMTQGGFHPRNKTIVNVSPLKANFTESIAVAAKIFYQANSKCLTPGSDFRLARFCTLMFAEDEQQKKTVSDAWGAVGVTDLLTLQSGETTTLSYLYTGGIQEYELDVPVLQGQALTCTIAGNNGDADMYVRLDDHPDPFPFVTTNGCSGVRAGSQHTCTTLPTAKPTKAYITIHAYSEFTNLTVQCAQVDVCKATNAKC